MLKLMTCLYQLTLIPIIPRSQPEWHDESYWYFSHTLTKFSVSGTVIDYHLPQIHTPALSLLT